MTTSQRHSRPPVLTPPETLTYLRLRGIAERETWMRAVVAVAHLGPYSAAGTFWMQRGWYAVVGFHGEKYWHTMVARRPEAMAEFHLLVQRLRLL